MSAFTDAKGRTVDYETGVRLAVECVVRQSEARQYVEAALRDAGLDEIRLWLVYPDTDEFADDVLPFASAIGRPLSRDKPTPTGPPTDYVP